MKSNNKIMKKFVRFLLASVMGGTMTLLAYTQWLQPKKQIQNNSDITTPTLLPVNYSLLKPTLKSPLDNLNIGNTSQIYPEDRGTNYSVKIAGEIVSLITIRML